MAVDPDLVFARDFTAPYGVAVPMSARVTRVLSDNPGPFTFRGTGTHLVGTGTGAVAVIDPGPDLPDHLAALQRAIGTRPVSHILVTHSHRDHAGATPALKAWSGAQTFALAGAPQEGSSGVPVEEAHDHHFAPDHLLRDGQSLVGEGFTLTCVATPGHTAGHACFALEEENALFSGDHVMGWSTSVIAPPDGSIGAYLESLERLIARDDTILYPAHGGPIRQPRAWLGALLAHRRRREAEVLAAWQSGLRRADAIALRLYPHVPPALQGAAAVQVQAHLEHLEQQGTITPG